MDRCRQKDKKYGKGRRNRKRPHLPNADSPHLHEECPDQPGREKCAPFDPDGQVIFLIGMFLLHHEYSFLYSLGFKPAYFVKVFVKYRTSL